MISMVATTAGLVDTVKECFVASLQALHGCRVADIVGMHAGIDFLMVPSRFKPCGLVQQTGGSRQTHSHKLTDIVWIHAGSDFLTIPCRLEPCGFVQRHAAQHIFIPVMATTAGLVTTDKHTCIPHTKTYRRCVDACRALFPDAAHLLCVLQPCASACNAAHHHCSGGCNSRTG